MFTGIIEAIGEIKEIFHSGSNTGFWISSSLSGQFHVDQSVSHNGVCLTVEKTENDNHQVTAISETLQKTNLGDWKIGDFVNLERSLLMNSRLDGHLVQGHVDATGECVDRKDLDGSWEFRFKIPDEYAHLIIEKGSICLNGISLTIFDVDENAFSVGIIPYTFNHTNISKIFPGHSVNLEFDLIGKYVSRIMGATNSSFIL
jgi:riboflavin synthase